MSLEQSILKEFAKITNDSSQNNQNGYLRGTAKLEGNKKFVRIDGSTSLTPISEIVDVQDGDRVLVTIENHKATVIGNVTKPPSARKEEEALDKANGAQDSANTAMEKAKEAGEKAEDALTDSSIASALADEAKQSAKEANEAADKAMTSADDAKQSAKEANEASADAINKASQAQADIANANNEISRINGEVTDAKSDISDALTALGEQASEIGTIKETYTTKIETDTVKADLTTEISKKVGELQTTITENYYTKTDVVEIEGKLQSQITQNAEGLTSTASKIEKLQSDTEKAQEDVNKALDTAQKAKDSADTAIKNAADAKAEAEESEANAKMASEKAQASRELADKAEEVIIKADKSLAESRTALNEAEKNLEFVLENPSATEDEIAMARAKVEAAQIAVNAALEDVAEAKYAADKATEAAELAEQEALTAMNIASAANSRAYTAKLAADKAMRDAKKAQADVASLTLRVTSAETKIDQNADAITLSAKKVDEIGDSLKNDYYSKTQTDAAIKVSADNIKSTVSETVETEIGKLQIGVKNLALNSKYAIELGDEYKIVDGTLSEPWLVGETYTITVKGLMVNKNDMFSGLGLWRDEGNKSVDTSIWYNEDKGLYILEFKCPEAAPTDTLLNTFSLCNYPSATALSAKLEWVKIERGNKVSLDWSPAPEDTENAIGLIEDNVYDARTDMATLIDQTSTSIKMEVSEKYYDKDETSELFKEQSTSFEQTKNMFEMQFKKVFEDINNIGDGSNSNYEEIKKYIRFVDGNIVLGQVGNELELVISNNKITFMQAGNEVAYFSNSKLYITDSEILNSLQIGKFAFVPRSNGSLDFKKVG